MLDTVHQKLVLTFWCEDAVPVLDIGLDERTSPLCRLISYFTSSIATGLSITAWMSVFCTVSRRIMEECASRS